MAAPPTPNSPVEDTQWSAARLRRLLPYVIVGVLLLVGLVILGRRLHGHVSELEAWISSLGVVGIVAFIALFVVATSAFVPESIFSVIAGALFGLGWGMVTLLGAITVASLLQYGLARAVLREPINRMLDKRPSLRAIITAVRRDEFRLQFMLRLTPLNPAMTSYALGAADVRPVGFLIACMGLLPGLFVEAYIGHAGRRVAHVAGQSELDIVLHDILLFGGLALCIVVLAIISAQARRAVKEASAPTEMRGGLLRSPWSGR